MNNSILDDTHLLNTATKKEGNIFTFALLLSSYCSLPFFPSFDLTSFIGAGLLLAVNLFLILWRRSIGILFTGFLCVFASLNLVHFFPFEMLAFRLSSTIAFDYISAPIFLGSYILYNEDIFLSFRNRWVANRNKNYIKSSNQTYFKKSFEHKSIPELEAILENPSIVPDAKKAAAELLEYKS